ncbi:MAG: NfeD family protein [Dehalococcoidales bacterium]|nr:NfeD family protein [Dehalococcoidales bacterium]
MRGRLIFAIFSTLFEEIALVVIVLWGLPQLGVQIPLVGLIALMAALVAYAIISYRLGGRALRGKPVVGTMVGSKGKVVSPLAPEGLIKIKGELWEATSVGKSIDTGEEVTVVGQDGLKLAVREGDTNDLRGSE